jgi:hypothetical protein
MRERESGRGIVEVIKPPPTIGASMRFHDVGRRRSNFVMKSRTAPFYQFCCSYMSIVDHICGLRIAGSFKTSCAAIQQADCVHCSCCRREGRSGGCVLQEVWIHLSAEDREATLHVSRNDSAAVFRRRIASQMVAMVGDGILCDPERSIVTRDQQGL